MIRHRNGSGRATSRSARADLESRAAIMVADIDSECVLADGLWLFALHLVKPLFVGGEGATLPPVSNLVPGK